jgi:HAD superfamily hydrolase (TIGR01450 family)
MNFNRFNTFIFDLDGTIWNWESLYLGVREKIERLQKIGKQVIFTTNNTILSQKNLLKKIRNFGIDLEKNQLITAGFVAARYLSRKDEKVLAFGNGIKEDLRENNIKLTRKADCKFLVVGSDENFNFNKLPLAKEALDHGAKFLATTRDRFWICGNKIAPGTGLIVETIEKFCRKKAKILGKPSEIFGKVLCSFISSPTNKTVIFGDNCKTDILLGRKLGFYTVLVLSGIDKKIGKIKPHAIINSVADIKI